MRTSELIGAQLDWAVAKAEGHHVEPWHSYRFLGMPNQEIVDLGVTIGERDEFGQIGYTPSSDWGQGGPIVEREWISIEGDGIDSWRATPPNLNNIYLNNICQRKYGPTPLVAAMRCYCYKMLGDEIDIPEYLYKVQK